MYNTPSVPQPRPQWMDEPEPPPILVARPTHQTKMQQKSTGRITSTSIVIIACLGAPACFLGLVLLGANLQGTLLEAPPAISTTDLGTTRRRVDQMLLEMSQALESASRENEGNEIAAREASHQVLAEHKSLISKEVKVLDGANVTWQCIVRSVSEADRGRPPHVNIMGQGSRLNLYFEEEGKSPSDISAYYTQRLIDTRQQLQQVLNNLGAYTRPYTPEPWTVMSGPHIRHDALRSLRPGDRLRITGVVIFARPLWSGQDLGSNEMSRVDVWLHVTQITIVPKNP